MIHFKHFTSLQWFGFILILSFVLMILSLFTNEPAPLFFIFVNGLGALFSFLLIRWPSKGGYPVPMPGVILNDANASDFRFNPVGGKSAEEILLWFQQIAEVELNAHQFSDKSSVNTSTFRSISLVQQGIENESECN